MTTETQTRPEQTSGTKDDRLRHYVERLSPKGVEPVIYSDVALCGAKVKDFVAHNGTICQECVDESRKRPVEP